MKLGSVAFPQSIRALASIGVWRPLLVGMAISLFWPLANAASATSAITAVEVPFKPQNGGRQVKSLSVHPNGQDWLFVECIQEQDDRCDVMRYNVNSGQLYRFALPKEYSYTYAHYSPQGNYIVMSRNPRYGDSEEDSRREVLNSQLVMMRSDGTGLEVIPVEPGVKLAPFMSLDESRIAFWRSERILPPNRQIGLMQFDIWEFDLKTKSEKLFAGRKFEFVTGGNLQYLGDDEILLYSYGPRSRIRAHRDLRKQYDRSEIYRLQRSQIEEPMPIVYRGIERADMPSIDHQGRTYLWGHTTHDRSLGVLRIGTDDDKTIWRTRSQFMPLDMTIDPNGRYLAVIYWDTPMDAVNRPGGFAKLDPNANTWTEVPVPSWEKAESLPVGVH